MPLVYIFAKDTERPLCSRISSESESAPSEATICHNRTQIRVMMFENGLNSIITSDELLLGELETNGAVLRLSIAADLNPHSINNSETQNQ